MKLNKEFLTTKIGGETFLVPVGEAMGSFHGIVKLNETAAFIVEQLKQDTTQGKIVDAICAQYEVECAVAEEHVNAALKQLIDIGAIIEKN